jgi:hypothetical protein
VRLGELVRDYVMLLLGFLPTVLLHGTPLPDDLLGDSMGSDMDGRVCIMPVTLAVGVDGQPPLTFYRCECS